MAKSTTAADWTRARLKPTEALSPEESTGNIFAGRASYHSTKIAGIAVVRISVVPEARQAQPQSFAVLNDELTDWTELAEPKLLYPLEWQQSRESRWDFSFPLPLGMRCLGLGERFSGNDLRGLRHTLCSTDQPHHSEGADALYKSIPFIILVDSNGVDCFGIFLDSPAPQIWDLDSGLTESANISLLSRRGWQLYVIGRCSLPEVVSAYTSLTGRADVPPLWALGHQQCRWSYPDEQTVLSIANEFRNRKIPNDTVVMDIDYMDEYRVFTHSPTRFPHFPQLSPELSRLQTKAITIVDPGIKQDPRYSIYKESIEKGLVCLTPEGKPFTEEVWPGECVFPDFMKAETRKWWGDNLKFYTGSGIAGIWNDMNEPAFFGKRHPLPKNPTELPLVAQQGFLQESPEGPVGHLEVRNLYGLLMSRATHEGLQRLNPGQRPFVLTRSAYAGIQKYSAVWLGDNMSWYEHLKKSITMLLNIGLSGVTFAGVDIGGFGGDTTPELLIRWYETGIFYPFFRNHCRMGDVAQEPWAFTPQVEAKISHLIATRYRLLPYIYSLFFEHRQSGAPLMRPVFWHYPQDALAWQLDDEFMLGADILVAPITDRAHTRRNVYLPAGRWYRWDDSTVIEGGLVHTLEMPLGCVPAFVREGAIIPTCDDPIQSTEEFASASITYNVFGDTAHGAFAEDDGATDKYKTGSFNMWSVNFSSDKFTAKISNSGHAADPKRKYFWKHNGAINQVKTEQ